MDKSRFVELLEPLVAARETLMKIDTKYEAGLENLIQRAKIDIAKARNKRTLERRIDAFKGLTQSGIAPIVTSLIDEAIEIARKLQETGGGKKQIAAQLRALIGEYIAMDDGKPVCKIPLARLEAVFGMEEAVCLDIIEQAVGDAIEELKQTQLKHARQIRGPIARFAEAVESAPGGGSARVSLRQTVAELKKDFARLNLFGVIMGELQTARWRVQFAQKDAQDGECDDTLFQLQSRILSLIAEQNPSGERDCIIVVPIADLNEAIRNS